MTTTADAWAPFPALTPAQRYHLDVFGYVIVPDVLSPDEVDQTKDALYRLRDELQRREADDNLRGAFLMINQPHHAYMGAIVQADPVLMRYAAHPKVVGMAEELIGGRSHLVEANAHINTRAPSWPTTDDGAPKYGFHRGLAAGEGTHTRNGLYHASFVKVLTNLTDLGPDDGGTVVVAGSHKVEAEDSAIIEAAYADRSLIHQVVAPAGSALLFTEALIHATGRITSDTERAIIIAGYTTAMFPWKLMDSHQPGFEMDPAFFETVPEQARYLFESKGYIQRKARHRKLGEPAV